MQGQLDIICNTAGGHNVNKNRNKNVSILAMTLINNTGEDSGYSGVPKRLHEGQNCPKI